MTTRSTSSSHYSDLSDHMRAKTSADSSSYVHIQQIKCLRNDSKLLAFFPRDIASWHSLLSASYVLTMVSTFSMWERRFPQLVSYLHLFVFKSDFCEDPAGDRGGSGSANAKKPNLRSPVRRQCPSWCFTRGSAFASAHLQID